MECKMEEDANIFTEAGKQFERVSVKASRWRCGN